MRSGPGADGGFSLIEVLLAIALLGILVSFYAGSIVQSMRMRERIAGTVRQFETMQGLMTRLENDVRGMYLEVRRSAAVDAAGNASSSEDVPHTALVLEDNSASGASLDSLNFTSSANAVFFLEGGDHNEFAHVEIGYEFVEDDQADDGSYRMLRRSDVTMDDDPMAGGAIYDVARGIRGFDVRVYDPVEKSWQDSWDSRDNGNTMPAAIQLFVWYGGDRDSQDSWKMLAKTLSLDVHSGGEAAAAFGDVATGASSGRTLRRPQNSGQATATEPDPNDTRPLCSTLAVGQRMRQRMLGQCQ